MAAHTSPSPALATPTPTVSIDRKDIKVKVLNGSGEKGKASEVKDLLKGKGYGEVRTDNADNFDYKITEIQVKKSKKGLDGLIVEDLKDNVSKPKVTELDESSPADVVVIFGADFK